MIVQIALEGMGRLFRMLPPKMLNPRGGQSGSQHDGHVTYTLEMQQRRERKRIRSPRMRNNKFDPDASDARHSPLPIAPSQSVASAPDFWQRLSLEEDIRDLRRSFREFEVRALRKQIINRHNFEWKYVALVLDRLFFFIYISTIVVSLITIFPHDDYFEAKGQ